MRTARVIVPPMRFDLRSLRGEMRDGIQNHKV